jgi:glycosyltransferase involved in cell wall biosynthesis
VKSAALKSALGRSFPPLPSRENLAINLPGSAFEIHNWAISDFVANRIVPIVGWPAVVSGPDDPAQRDPTALRGDAVLATQSEVPTVSVVVPCFGQATFLPEAVASVVEQTFGDWELVIVDDGSLDDAAGVAVRLIAENPGRRIRLLRQANRGLANARNAGIAVSKGRYVLPLDSDDTIAPTMLEETVRVLQHEPIIGIVYTDRQQFGERSDVFRAGRFDADDLLHWASISYCSLYRREVWEAVGGYNPNMIWGYEDWDFWVGCLERGYRARHIPKALFRYRVRPASMISNALQHDADLRAQIRLNHPGAYSPRPLVLTWGTTLIRPIRSRAKYWIRALRRAARSMRPGSE